MPGDIEMSSQRLDPLVQEFQQTAEKVRKAIHNLAGLVSENDRTAKGRINWVRYQSLSKNLADLMVEFNNEQMDYRERCKNYVRKALMLMGDNPTEDQLEEILHEGCQGDVFVRGTSREDIENARLMVEGVRTSQWEIAKLEASVHEMAAIFKEVSVLIQKQGETIDRIEDHVSNTEHHVDVGRANVAKTQRYKITACKKKCWIVASLVLALALIAIVVVLLKK
ncbi:syntaxin-1B-like [Tropilaelaps mercedesae]|uniref:Syntaxin-1B-like n=1 Tax=Tropilaelaps mercedesae TaxID=418985 RepID=A0A1V9X5C3_9ACAR|nr:syntaxin-1B-like [Tropilaelaps mercedesae]